MNTVWKYRLELTGKDQTVEMPHQAQVITLGVQDGILCLWALGNSAAESKKRIFRVFGTGHPVPVNYVRYVGTVFDDSFVWHVFEKAEE